MGKQEQIIIEDNKQAPLYDDIKLNDVISGFDQNIQMPPMIDIPTYPSSPKVKDLIKEEKFCRAIAEYIGNGDIDEARNYIKSYVDEMTTAFSNNKRKITQAQTWSAISDLLTTSNGVQKAMSIISNINKAVSNQLNRLEKLEGGFKRFRSNINDSLHTTLDSARNILSKVRNREDFENTKIDDYLYKVLDSVNDGARYIGSKFSKSRK